MNQGCRFLETLLGLLILIGITQVPTAGWAQQDRPGNSADLGGKVIVSKTSGIKLAWIPAGSFSMGSLPSEEGHTRNEIQHIVRITRPFYIGFTEVTQAEFELLTEKNPSAFSRSGTDAASVKELETSHFPVENVSWYDAIEFCNLLSRKDGVDPYYSLTNIEREDGQIKSATVAISGGNGYRLPTEAEWEYACRSGTGTSYSSGDSVGLLDRSGWYGMDATKAGNSDKHPHRVGQKAANDFGLFDMHGNVSEWCQDWSDYGYYDRSPTNDPIGPPGGASRIRRGGSWVDDALNCRSAYRGTGHPIRKSNDTGFRVVRTHIVKSNPQKLAGDPPYRIVVNLRDDRVVDVFRQEVFDTLESAKQRLADAKLFGRTGNIRIIDANGRQID